MLNPWHFVVDSYGTVIEDGQELNNAPWSTLFDIATEGIKFVDDLIRVVEDCMPLQSVFAQETWDLVADFEAQAQSASELLEQLGVFVIEGEHSGRSYYAADLRQDIDKAK